MVEISSINSRPATETLIKQLRYPDADRVIQNFIEILPDDIKNAVVNGEWPTAEQNKEIAQLEEEVMSLRDNLNPTNGGAQPKRDYQQPPLPPLPVDNLNVDE